MVCPRSYFLLAHAKAIVTETANAKRLSCALNEVATHPCPAAKGPTLRPLTTATNVLPSTSFGKWATMVLRPNFSRWESAKETAIGIPSARKVSCALKGMHRRRCLDV